MEISNNVDRPEKNTESDSQKLPPAKNNLRRKDTAPPSSGTTCQEKHVLNSNSEKMKPLQNAGSGYVYNSVVCDPDFIADESSQDYRELYQWAVDTIREVEDNPGSGYENKLSDKGFHPDKVENYKYLLAALDKVEKKEHLSTAKFREAILNSSNGKLLSWQTYMTGHRPLSACVDKFWSIGEKPENWIPERRSLQYKAVADTIIKARGLSDYLHDAHGYTDRLILTGGNYGMGKTELISGLFSGYEPDAGDSAVSADNSKEKLRQSPYGSPKATPNAIHSESSLISHIATNELMKEPGRNVIMDSSLSNPKWVNYYLNKAVENNKTLDIKYVAGDLYISLFRVLMRPRDGVAPRIPYNSIVKNFKRTQGAIRESIDLALKNPENMELSIYPHVHENRTPPPAVTIRNGKCDRDALDSMIKDLDVYEKNVAKDRFETLEVRKYLKEPYMPKIKKYLFQWKFQTCKVNPEQLKNLLGNEYNRLPQHLQNKLKSGNDVTYLDLPIGIALDYNASLCPG